MKKKSKFNITDELKELEYFRTIGAKANEILILQLILFIENYGKDYYTAKEEFKKIFENRRKHDDKKGEASKDLR